MAKKPTPLDEDALAAVLGTDADETDEADTYTDLSEDDLAVLSEAEREALEAAKEEDDFADEGEEGDDPAAAAQSAAAEAESAAEAAAQEPDAESVAAAEMQRRQQEELARLQSELDTINKSQKDLRTQLLEGEISEEEFETQTDELTGKRDEANRKLAIADHEANAAQREADKAWERAEVAFSKAHPEFVSDEHFDGFNAAVGAVTADPKFAALSFEKQLDIAAQTYALQAQALGHDLSFSAAPAQQQTKGKGKTKADSQQASQQEGEKPARKAPPTLAHVPAETMDPHQSNVAAITAQLARASGVEREKIMARIPDDMIDEVLSHG